MYSVVLAAMIATGDATPAQAGGVTASIQDLQRAVEELRRSQTEQRADELKQELADLREKRLERKIDELRRELHHRHGGREHHPPHAPRGRAAGPAAPGDRATVTVRMPPGTRFVANGQEVPLPGPETTFVTPPLEPGRGYHYDFRATADRDGGPVTKAQRVPV